MQGKRIADEEKITKNKVQVTKEYSRVKYLQSTKHVIRYNTEKNTTTTMTAPKKFNSLTSNAKRCRYRTYIGVKAT